MQINKQINNESVFYDKPVDLSDKDKVCYLSVDVSNGLCAVDYDIEVNGVSNKISNAKLVSFKGSVQINNGENAIIDTDIQAKKEVVLDGMISGGSIKCSLLEVYLNEADILLDQKKVRVDVEKIIIHSDLDFAVIKNWALQVFGDHKSIWLDLDILDDLFLISPNPDLLN